MALADLLFKMNVSTILEGGSFTTGDVRAKWQDGTPAHTVHTFGIINRYNLQQEFPLLTIRKQNFKNLVDEILWIWVKNSNMVKDLSSKIWDAWAKEDGSIGKAYGYQLGLKHDYPEGKFTQVERALYELKNNRNSRRIVINMFIPQDLSEMSLYPCAHSLTLDVVGNRLNGILNQRSQDFIVANGWNVAQYAVLLHMFAFVNRLEPGELIHVISDAHIYDRHIQIARDILKEDEYPAPKFSINRDVKDFFDFKVEDFTLEDYKYSNKIYSIPVAI